MKTWLVLSDEEIKTIVTALEFMGGQPTQLSLEFSKFKELEKRFREDVLPELDQVSQLELIGEESKEEYLEDYPEIDDDELDENFDDEEYFDDKE